jgi:protein gp37
MNDTNIEYLDVTLNLIVGCSGDQCAVRKVCWAMRMAKRQKHRCPLCYAFTPHYHAERWKEPFLAKKAKRIGLNFMGETFDRNLPNREEVLREIVVMMTKAYWHTFVILTKQPQLIPLSINWPRNLWLGVTVNVIDDLWRIEQLKNVNAAVKFVSFEPLLENLCNVVDLRGIDWVIIGAQTRPNIQPRCEWVVKLTSVAKEEGGAVFWKNNLAMTPRIQEFPKGER